MPLPHYPSTPFYTEMAESLVILKSNGKSIGIFADFNHNKKSDLEKFFSEGIIKFSLDKSFVASLRDMKIENLLESETNIDIFGKHTLYNSKGEITKIVDTKLEIVDAKEYKDYYHQAPLWVINCKILLLSEERILC